MSGHPLQRLNDDTRAPASPEERAAIEAEIERRVALRTAPLVERIGLLQEAIEHMDQGLLMIDGTGSVLINNRRLIEMLDLPASLFESRPRFIELLNHQIEHGEFELTDQTVQRTFTGDITSQQHRYVRKRPDGTVLEVRTVPLPHGGAVRTFTDVTEATRKEETLQVAQTELIAAREKAEAASRAKSEFLAAMSHEIRTPLNAVLGLATSLLESPLESEPRRMVQAIHNSGDSLLEILNDILDFSRLEARVLTFESISFAPTSLVANTVSIIGPRGTGKGLAMDYRCDPAIPAGLIGDAGRIRQVLLNLLSNAIKFTQSGSVCVNLSLIGKQNGNALIEWAVSDTGIGITEEAIGKLFKDFSQADESINRRFGGSGLGLAICKRIIEQMGGTVGVRSEIGRGSTFWFQLSLPIAATVVDPISDDKQIYAMLKARIRDLGRPLRILVVDDNASNRLVATKLLAEFEPMTNVACDGSEAVTAASRFRYDVILMDMHMPEMDGLQATRAIRKKGINVPVVAFTANAFKEDIDACLASGMSGFVAKPVRKKELVRAIIRNVAWTGEQTAGESAADRDTAGQTQSSGDDEIDLAAFDELAGEIGADGVEQALVAFCEDAEAKIKLLAAGNVDEDRPQIRRYAHSIKGAAATLGMSGLSSIARSLEGTAHKISASQLNDAATDMTSALKHARTLLATRIAALPSASPENTEQAA
ncbi:MAG: ATP-binding protein [Hyphomicrobiaceae bacterium]